jgi:hypothetical protein
MNRQFQLGAKSERQWRERWCSLLNRFLVRKSRGVGQDPQNTQR